MIKADASGQLYKEVFDLHLREFIKLKINLVDYFKSDYAYQPIKYHRLYPQLHLNNQEKLIPVSNEFDSYNQIASNYDLIVKPLITD